LAGSKERPVFPGSPPPLPCGRTIKFGPWENPGGHCRLTSSSLVRYTFHFPPSLCLDFSPPLWGQGGCPPLPDLDRFPWTLNFHPMCARSAISWQAETYVRSSFSPSSTMKLYPLAFCEAQDFLEQNPPYSSFLRLHVQRTSFVDRSSLWGPPRFLSLLSRNLV